MHCTVQTGKIMQKLPDHCYLKNEITDVQRLTTASGNVHGVTVNQQCICLHCAVYCANAELYDPAGRSTLTLCCLTSRCAQVTAADSTFPGLVSPGLSLVP